MPKARTLRELIVDLHRVVMGNGTNGLAEWISTDDWYYNITVLVTGG